MSQKPTVQGLPFLKNKFFCSASTYGRQRPEGSLQHTLHELSVSETDQSLMYVSSAAALTLPGPQGRGRAGRQGPPLPLLLQTRAHRYTHRTPASARARRRARTCRPYTCRDPGTRCHRQRFQEAGTRCCYLQCGAHGHRESPGPAPLGAGEHLAKHYPAQCPLSPTALPPSGSTRSRYPAFTSS